MTSIKYFLVLFFTICMTFLLFGLSVDSLSVGQSQIRKTILYDGVCNFCNSWVDLILKLDAKKQFSFCALQSERGQSILEKVGKEKGDISSVVYVRDLGTSTQGLW